MWNKRRQGNVVSVLLLHSDLASVYSQNLFTYKMEDKY